MAQSIPWAFVVNEERGTSITGVWFHYRKPILRKPFLNPDVQSDATAGTNTMYGQNVCDTA